MKITVPAAAVGGIIAGAIITLVVVLVVSTVRIDAPADEPAVAQQDASTAPPHEGDCTQP